jgi:NMD protein affecting ribosome stability and mRNA decay
MANNAPRLGVEGEIMNEKTCAACDCRIEGPWIDVTVGGKTVEVCCDDCARTLNEAYAPGLGVQANEGARVR